MFRIASLDKKVKMMHYPMLYLTLKGINMLPKNIKNDFPHRLINNSIQLMQTKAENSLNPHRHYLSKEAKKRLRCLYGGENEKDFFKYLNENNTIHFYSRRRTEISSAKMGIHI